MIDTNAPWKAIDGPEGSLPPDSRQVIITDGEDIGVAHFFAEAYKPSTGDVTRNKWANQHMRITGEYIEKPTHWMTTDEFINFMLQGLK